MPELMGFNRGDLFQKLAFVVCEVVTLGELLGIGWAAEGK